MGFCQPLLSAADSGLPSLKSATVWCCLLGPGLQYCGKFYHQYQLAVLCGRDDAQLSDADGRPNFAQLFERGNGNGSAPCFDARVDWQNDAYNWQFLGRPGAHGG